MIFDVEEDGRHGGRPSIVRIDRHREDVVDAWAIGIRADERAARSYLGNDFLIPTHQYQRTHLPFAQIFLMAILKTNFIIKIL